MLKFENPCNGRYYYMRIDQDLLGHTVLTVIRGGKLHNVTRHYAYNCLTKINSEIKRITKIRLKHGYILQ